MVQRPKRDSSAKTVFLWPAARRVAVKALRFSQADCAAGEDLDVAAKVG